jgi:hypothetical protein
VGTVARAEGAEAAETARTVVGRMDPETLRAREDHPETAGEPTRDRAVVTRAIPRVPEEARGAVAVTAVGQVIPRAPQEARETVAVIRASRCGRPPAEATPMYR